MYIRRADEPHRSVCYEIPAPCWISNHTRNIDTMINKNMIGYGGGFDVTNDPVVKATTQEEEIFFTNKVLSH